MSEKKGCLWGLLKFILLLIVLVFLFCVGAFLAKYVEVRKEYTNEKIQHVISKVEEKKNYIKIGQISKLYLDAVIAAEDHRFYYHGAVDPISISRAFLVNIESKSMKEGGSTITQQMVKNVFLNQTKSFDRKVTEFILSIIIEKMYTKDKILELYVNTSYFGDGYEGIKEASVGYFGVQPDNLTLAQAAFLAGVPNAPSVYTPSHSYELALQRRNIVLEKMFKANYITEQEYETTKKEGIEVVKKYD